MTTTPTAPVTITLAVPTPFAVDPARLVAWLAAEGYTLAPSHPDDSCWIVYRRTGKPNILLPDLSEWEPNEYTHALAGSVAEAAEAEGLEPSALAALLAPPADGPALQWQHASPAVRAAAIARIADLAATDRQSVAILRADGCAEQALEAEGDALGLEAAAAWLRETVSK